MKISLLYTFLFLGMLVVFNSVIAQEKNDADKLVMLNGDERIGQVTEINVDNIKFVHQGEALSYTFKKSEIYKIQFASGRIEIMNEISDSKNGDAGIQLQDHHNVVAVLPFSFISPSGGNDMAHEKKAQSECFNVLNRFARDFKLQDPVTTNALLLKHNISHETIESFTPAEICHVLGTEYVVMGLITVLHTGSVQTSGVSETKKKKGNKVLDFTTSSSSSYENFRTEVDMKIYSDQGQNIYSRSHNSFWQVEDAYEITLQWLVKRSPLYRK